VKPTFFLSFDFANDEDLRQLMFDEASQELFPMICKAWSEEGVSEDIVRERIRSCDKFLVLCGELTHQPGNVDEEFKIAVGNNPNSAKAHSSLGLVYSEKETVIDDPIRLYLREIGKENLLNAEQEVELSKRMEEGENIIKGVIKNSGMLIPEFYFLAQRAFSRKDPRELNLSKKEISEYLAERRRLSQYYKDYLKDVFPTLKQYMEQKKKINLLKYMFKIPASAFQKMS